MNATVYTRPLVPRHLFRFGTGLEAALPKGHTSFFIYHPKISLLVDPAHVKANLGNQTLTDVAYDGSVDLAVIDGLPEGVPYAAFDIWRGQKPKDHKAKTALFRRFGISYRCLEAEAAISKINEIAAGISEIVPEVDELRGAINSGQWAAMERVARVAKNNRLYLLHEVALESVIAIQDIEPDGSGRGLPLFLNRDFLSRTSFDAIVTTPPPNAKPICAVEFDGRHHREQAQRSRDARKDAACEEAKLPLIRIPARDTTVSASTGRVVQFRNLRSPDTPEIVWKQLEAIVTELSKTHLGSGWYMRQLHHFLHLEAEHLKSVDPDSSLTINGYAQEIWDLAIGQIAKLENQVSQLIESDRERATWDEWLLDYHRDPDQEADEELYRTEDIAYELYSKITKDFDSSVLRQNGLVRLFELKFWSEETQDGSSNRFLMSIESSALLNELGIPISRKTFTEGPLGLTVIGDPYGITTNLITSIPKQFLLARVIRVAQSHWTRIQAAGRVGYETIWEHVAADVWSRAELVRLKRHLLYRIQSALSAKTLVGSPGAWEKFGQGDDSGLEYREVPVPERLEKLMKLAEQVRPVLQRLSIEPKEKQNLSEYFENLVSEAQATPTSFRGVDTRKLF